MINFRYFNARMGNSFHMMEKVLGLDLGEDKNCSRTSLDKIINKYGHFFN